MIFQLGFLLAGMAGVTSGVFASEPQVQVRSFTNSCGYYSSRLADVQVSYQNEALEWGVRVQLVYGAEGETVRSGGSSVVFERFDWDQQAEKTMVASGPFQWSTQFRLPVAYRSSPKFIDGLDFVFQIVHADGRIEYDNGTSSPLGYFKVHFPYNAACVVGGEPTNEYLDVEVQRINRG